MLATATMTAIDGHEKVTVYAGQLVPKTDPMVASLRTLPTPPFEE
jgi:hypothetical protein